MTRISPLGLEMGIAQALGVVGIAGLALLGLLAANFLRDRGVDASVSRRVAAVLGGGAYLIAVLALDAWTATALSGAIALLVLALRLRFRQQLRGVSGAAGAERWGEIAYPLAGAASIAVGWGVLGDRWLAFVPIAFMAWGDNAAGFVRARVPSALKRNPWASATMLAACLSAATLYQPYWVGVAGALAATAAEGFRPIGHPLWDDNWTIVAASLSVMALFSTAGAQ